MRTRTVIAVPVAVGLVAAGAWLAVPSQARTAAAPPVASTWLGLGYNQDPQYRGAGAPAVWTAAAFAQMTQRADYIRPGMVRVMVNRSWFNPSGTAGQYTWNSIEMQNVFKVLGYYKSRNVKVQAGMWGVSPSPDANPYTAMDTATVQADLMSQFVHSGYTNVVRYNAINEPNVITDVKRYKYADWVSATMNLRAAFSKAGLSTNLIVGPDTAEAGISEQDGDLGLESVPVANAKTAQNLVWHVADASTFSVRFYVTPDPSAVDWSFQASPNGTTWTTVPTTHTTPTATVGTDPWYRTDSTPTGTLPKGTNYIRLTMPAHAQVERAVSSFTAGMFTDPMNDLSRTFSHTSGWTHPGGSATNDWWLQTALTSPPLVAGLDAHFYDREVDLGSPPGYVEPVLTTAVGQLKAADPGAPVILSETGMKAPQDANGNKDYSFTLPYEHGVRMADLAVQEARAGLDGAMAWCLDGYEPGIQCGMWDASGRTATQTALRPWFYTWSLLCRYLPAGSTLYAPTDPANVRVLTAHLPDGGWTFVVVNRGTAGTTVTLTAPTGQITLNKYLYSPSGSPTDPATGFPVPTGTLKASFDSGHGITLGADSVAVYTTMP